jgi:hypothetical protein
MAKHNIGDLVARCAMYTGEIKLGYISGITSEYVQGYFVYFFDTEKDIWYSQVQVECFKRVLEYWSKNG